MLLELSKEAMASLFGVCFVAGVVVDVFVVVLGIRVVTGSGYSLLCTVCPRACGAITDTAKTRLRRVGHLMLLTTRSNTRPVFSARRLREGAHLHACHASDATTRAVAHGGASGAVGFANMRKRFYVTNWVWRT